ncbi:DUF6507 family protein [Streptomyces sp. NPDC041068]|uniref:DUF6507 family protein n=1 Tax=Streptomyces sp. NPDC041068 TaxID=3155130 RepID=UPI003404F206
MPKWDIDPAGVGVVTSRVGDVLDALDKIVKTYGEELEGAAKTSGTVAPGGASAGGEGGPMGLVASALTEFIAGTAQELQFIGARAGKSINGAINATAAYRMGDLEMAAHTQQQAAAIIDADLDMPGGLTRGHL